MGVKIFFRLSVPNRCCPAVPVNFCLPYSIKYDDFTHLQVKNCLKKCILASEFFAKRRSFFIAAKVLTTAKKNVILKVLYD